MSARRRERGWVARYVSVDDSRLFWGVFVVFGLAGWLRLRVGGVPLLLIHCHAVDAAGVVGGFVALMGCVVFEIAALLFSDRLFVGEKDSSRKALSHNKGVR